MKKSFENMPSGNIDNEIILDKHPIPKSCKDIPIENLEYSPGSGAGRAIKEYLIKRVKGKCPYCGRDCIKEKVPMNVDHIIPRSKGGHNRIGNLTISCVECNSKKGDTQIER